MGPLAHSGAALSAVLGAPLLALGCACSARVRDGIGERLGAHPGVRERAVRESAPIWVHGASVGEVRCAVKLARALASRGHGVVGSATTTSGRARWRALAPEIAAGLAPLDHPWLVRRALARVGPRALVLLETELWPCWIAAARERGVPVAIASARISERSFPRYRRARPVVRRVLASVAAIGARSEGDAERFVALGADPARVSVTGDLKLEPEPPAALAPELAAAIGALPLFVAGSTHPGEEEAALVALAAAEAQGLRPALVLAPRRVARASEVAALARGRRVVRRSALGTSALRAGDVLVLDTLGELGALYAHARAAFVGGTLASGVGGHDLAEAAHCAIPVLFGPETQSTRAVAELLLASGAGERVANARELGRALCGVLADPRAAAERGERGRQALASQRGATERTLALLERALGAA